MAYVAMLNKKTLNKEIYNNDLIHTKFMFSWVLATNSKIINGERHTARAVLDNMERELDKLFSAGKEMKVFISPMYRLISGSIAQKQLANCDDYFRFVELATTIVGES